MEYKIIFDNDTELVALEAKERGWAVWSGIAGRVSIHSKNSAGNATRKTVAGFRRRV